MIDTTKTVKLIENCKEDIRNAEREIEVQYRIFMAVRDAKLKLLETRAHLFTLIEEELEKENKDA